MAAQILVLAAVASGFSLPGPGPDETYDLIASCSAAYNASDEPPALSCPDHRGGPELLVPHSWLLDADGQLTEPWQSDRHGIRDRVSVYFDLWWKGCNPGHGQWNMGCIGDDIAAVAAAGYKVAIGPGMHKAPDYLFTKFDAYWRNAEGTALQNGDDDMGANVVFYPEVREVVREYYLKIRDRLQEINATLSLLRIGFAQTGEFNYPISSGGNDYWAFGVNGSAFSGYPLGTWRPGQPTSNENAKTFLAWYLEALAATQNDMVGYVLEIFPEASAAMLYPNAETLYVDLLDETSKLAGGVTSGRGTAHGWVRSLLVPRLADVQIAGKILAWSTSALGGEERFQTLDKIRRFTEFSSPRIDTQGLSIALATENEGGQIQDFSRLRDYFGHARADAPELMFLCCMSLPISEPDDLYALVAATKDAFSQSSVLCYPNIMRGVDDRLYSVDMSKMLRLQGDGNLVVYEVDVSRLGADPTDWWCGASVWSTGTSGSQNPKLVIQTDGGAHVVMYDEAGTVLASSNYVKCTMSGHGCASQVVPRLSLEADGSLLLTTDIAAKTLNLKKHAEVV